MQRRLLGAAGALVVLGAVLVAPVAADPAADDPAADERAAVVVPVTGTDAPAATGPVAGPPVPPVPRPEPDGAAGEHHDGHDHPGTAPAAASTPAVAAAAPAPAAPAAAPAPAAPAAPSPSSGAGRSTATAAPGTVTGTLVRLWVDDAAHAHAPQAWLETGSGSRPGASYRVADAAVSGLSDGARVTARLGARTPGTDAHPVLEVVRAEEPVLAAGAVEFGAGSTDVFGAAAATVQHEVTVVLAHPATGPRDATTTAALTDVVATAANGYWHQQSRGQRGFRVTRAVGWTPFAASCKDDPFAVWSEVAREVGWTAGPRKHLLLYIPVANGCGSGLGTVGSSPDSGGRSWVGTLLPSITAHELGHNLGLGHANGLLCTDRPDGTWSSGPTSAGTWQAGCAHHEYRNYYDVMGVSWSNLGSLAAPNADALGLLRSTERLVTSDPVRVRLVPQTGEGLRVLRVDEGAATYYVEYRVATGWDSWLAGNSRGLDPGVVVTRRSPLNARQSVLLDGSVTTGTRTSDWASALKPGTTLRTASGTTTITVEQQSSTGATVVVTRNGTGPDAVTAPKGLRQVELRSPSVRAAAVGTTVFAGVGTAPEGTLLWEVVEGGTVRASGTALTGANGTFDTFQVPIALPAGTYTFRVWVPDDSDGEGGTTGADPSLLVDETTITVS